MGRRRVRLLGGGTKHKRVDSESTRTKKMAVEDVPQDVLIPESGMALMAGGNADYMPLVH